MRFHFPWIEQHGRNARLRRGTATARFRKPIARPQVEGLESRRLLSLTINEYPLAGGAVQHGIVSGPDGNLWFTEPLTGRIGEINPTTHAITVFAIPTANGEPEDITASPDGNLWFTETTVGKIGEINPTTHVITEFPIPTADSSPVGITAGPDGNIWFTEEYGNNIGEINPTSDVIIEFPIPTAASIPIAITTGPDGNLWFIEQYRNAVGEISPTTHAITEFPVPTNAAFLNSLTEITAGPDGNLWFTEADSNQIGEIDPTTHIFTEFPIPTASSLPLGITGGPDGNLWFTEQNGNNVGRINPTTHVITEFPVPTYLVEPQQITAGPDGSLWFTEMGYMSLYPPNYPSYSNIGQVVVEAVAPDLALSGTAPESVPSGSNVTYTLTVTNDGSGTATGGKLTDTLPAGVTFVSATGGITPVANGLTFTIGNLAAGASTSDSFVVAPTVPGTLTDSALVTMDQYDPTLNDNSVTLTTSVMSVTADVALSGKAPTIVLRGSNLPYTLTVTNNGGTEATGVTLIDTLPAGVTFVSAIPAVTPVNGVLTFALGNLAAGASTIVYIDTYPLAVPHQVQLTDTASVSMDQTDPTPADNSISLNTASYYATDIEELGADACTSPPCWC